MKINHFLLPCLQMVISISGRKLTCSDCWKLCQTMLTTQQATVSHVLVWSLLLETVPDNVDNTASNRVTCGGLITTVGNCARQCWHHSKQPCHMWWFDHYCWKLCQTMLTPQQATVSHVMVWSLLLETVPDNADTTASNRVTCGGLITTVGNCARQCWHHSKQPCHMWWFDHYCWKLCQTMLTPQQATVSHVMVWSLLLETVLDNADTTASNRVTCDGLITTVGNCARQCWHHSKQLCHMWWFDHYCWKLCQTMLTPQQATVSHVVVWSLLLETVPDNADTTASNCVTCGGLITTVGNCARQCWHHSKQPCHMWWFDHYCWKLCQTMLTPQQATVSHVVVWSLLLETVPDNADTTASNRVTCGGLITTVGNCARQCWHHSKQPCHMWWFDHYCWKLCQTMLTPQQATVSHVVVWLLTELHSLTVRRT